MCEITKKEWDALRDDVATLNRAVLGDTKIQHIGLVENVETLLCAEKLREIERRQQKGIYIGLIAGLGINAVSGVSTLVTLVRLLSEVGA